MKEINIMYMKKIVGFSVVLCLVLMMSDCDRHNDNLTTAEKETPGFVSFSHTGCKSSALARAFSSDDDVSETVRLEAKENGSILIQHNNAIFNCGISNLQGNVELITEKVIKISYNYSLSPEGETDCICLFDMNYIVSGMKEGEGYTIYIKNSKSVEKEIQFIYTKLLNEIKKIE